MMGLCVCVICFLWCSWYYVEDGVCVVDHALNILTIILTNVFLL